MKGRREDTPNLDDVLARDFAELKVGEENLKVEATTETEAPPPSSPPATPVAYNQRIDAVEDRESFAVKAPQQREEKSTTSDDEEDPAPSQTILKAPSTQQGDDFDVEW